MGAIKGFVAALGYSFLTVLAPLLTWGLVLWLCVICRRSALAATVLAILVTLYVWITYSLKRGRLRYGIRSKFFSNLRIWRWMGEHYRIGLEYAGPAPLDKGRHYIFCIHPHGVLALERYAFWASRAARWDTVFPGIETRDLCATALMLVPGSRTWCLLTGAVLADRPVAAGVLRDTPHSLLMYPGGEREQMATEYGRDKVWVRRHRGFVRLALENGAPLVPCYMFGVTSQYRVSSLLGGFRTWLQRTFAVALPLFYGRSPLLFWLPSGERPVTAVFGAPVEVVRTEHPTDEQIDEVMEKYVAALTKVYDDNKERFGCKDSTLEVI